MEIPYNNRKKGFSSLILPRFRNFAKIAKGPPMAKVTVVAFRDDAGNVPFLTWVEALPAKAQDKCWLRIKRLRDMGSELRRPEADYLRDGIYELRLKHLRVNYRVLYFFHGRSAVVLSHGLQKERLVPPRQIDLAVAHMNSFLADPARHTAKEDLP